MPVSHTVASHFLARLRSPAQGAVVDVAWFDAGDVEPGEQLVPASRRVIIPGGGNIDVRRQVTQRVMAGLDPAIPASTGIAKEAVTGYNGAGGDGRVKPGHDGLSGPCRTSIFWAAGISRELFEQGSRVAWCSQLHALKVQSSVAIRLRPCQSAPTAMVDGLSPFEPHAQQARGHSPGTLLHKCKRGGPCSNFARRLCERHRSRVSVTASPALRVAAADLITHPRYM